MTRINNYQIAIALLAILVSAVTIPIHAQTATELFAFPDEPSQPMGAVAQGLDGALYGTLSNGISVTYGGIYKITPAGNVRFLYDVCNPGCEGSSQGGLTLRPDGHFLGSSGSIFDVTQTGDFTVLYSFALSSAYPYAPPILGPDGYFYGVAPTGGGPSGCGTIYRLTKSGIALLHQFDKVHGCNPSAPMVLGTDGNLYGTTVNGGTGGGGVVFQLNLRPGKASVLTVLANFDETNGFLRSPLVQGSDGNFYGTTSGFATSYGTGPGTGTVFKITAGGALTVLHTLNGTTDGINPNGLVQATDGNFYGTTQSGGTPPPSESLSCGNGCGALFQITPDGTYSVLYSFDGFVGADPSTPLVQHTNGILYGAARVGGGCDLDFGCGTFFSWDSKLPPFVRTVKSMGSVGSSVEILGQGFNSSTTVTFNGIAAEVNLQSATSLYTKVPAGATTGFVTVTTSSGTLTSNQKFIVTP